MNAVKKAEVIKGILSLEKPSKDGYWHFKTTRENAQLYVDAAKILMKEGFVVRAHLNEHDRTVIRIKHGS